MAIQEGAQAGPAMRGFGEMRRRADGFRFLEGPVWTAARRSLIFSDIPGDCLYRFNPADDSITIHRTPSNKANGNVLDRQGRLVTCEHATSRVVREETDGKMTVIASHYGGFELNSPNDVVVDSSDRIYFTDPPYGRTAGSGVLLGVGIPREPEQTVRGVYRVDPRTKDVVRLVNDFEEPNGLCFAGADDVLLVNDTARGHIRRFELRGDFVKGGEVWATLDGTEPGVPDGMKVDAAGNVYCCGPGGVHVLDARGRRLGVIAVPEVAPISIGVTTICAHSTSAQPALSTAAAPKFRAHNASAAVRGHGRLHGAVARDHPVLSRHATRV